MNEIFFRTNNKKTSDFLDIITNDRSKELIERIVFTQKELKKISDNLVETINKDINIIISTDFDKEKIKKLRNIKKCIKKRRKLPCDSDEHTNKNLLKYSCLMETNLNLLAELERVSDNLRNNFLNSIPELLNEEDLILFKNTHLRKKLLKQSKLKKKDTISLYKFLGQISLKTGALGRHSKIGCISNYDTLNKFKRKYVLYIQNYIQNRIYREYLKQNLLNYKLELLINSNYTVNKEKKIVIFKTLIDNPKTNIFCGTEREVSISLNNRLEELIKRKRFYYIDALHLLKSNEVKKMIDYGIITYKHIKPDDNFSWIYDFKNTDNKIFNMILNITLNIDNLQSEISTQSIKMIENDIVEICNFFNIETLNLPVFTLDSYTDTLDEIDQESENLKAFSEEINDLNKFFTIFDASKKVNTLANKFMKESYKDGVEFNDFEQLDNFLKELADNIFTKINLGALRSGFFDLTEYPLIKRVLMPIISTDNTSYTITNDVLNDLESLAKKINYNMSSSYTFFLQFQKNSCIINHVYKGYGIFNNRYRNNFENINFENEYGFKKILDIPYYFGFNANQRIERSFFDPLENSEFDDIGISFRNISIRPNDNSSLSFFDKEKNEFYYSFLGSMTPMVLPKTIAMFNSLTPSGGMYFDIGDLVLREKFNINRNSDVYYSPRIYFKNDKIILSREKKLFNAKRIKDILYNKPHDVNTLIELIKILDSTEFFLKEFFVGANFKNKLEKPIYINLNSTFSLELFINYILNLDWIVIEEVSPDLNVNKYLTEYLLEGINKK